MPKNFYAGIALMVVGCAAVHSPTTSMVPRSEGDIPTSIVRYGDETFVLDVTGRVMRISIARCESTPFDLVFAGIAPHSDGVLLFGKSRANADAAVFHLAAGPMEKIAGVPIRHNNVRPKAITQEGSEITLVTSDEYIRINYLEPKQQRSFSIPHIAARARVSVRVSGDKSLISVDDGEFGGALYLLSPMDGHTTLLDTRRVLSAGFNSEGCIVYISENLDKFGSVGVRVHCGASHVERGNDDEARVITPSLVAASVSRTGTLLIGTKSHLVEYAVRNTPRGGVMTELRRYAVNALQKCGVNYWESEKGVYVESEYVSSVFEI